MEGSISMMSGFGGRPSDGDFEIYDDDILRGQASTYNRDNDRDVAYDRDDPDAPPRISFTRRRDQAAMLGEDEYDRRTHPIMAVFINFSTSRRLTLRAFSFRKWRKVNIKVEFMTALI